MKNNYIMKNIPAILCFIATALFSYLGYSCEYKSTDSHFGHVMVPQRTTHPNAAVRNSPQSTSIIVTPFDTDMEPF
jgi:hypothetical protein